MSACWATLHITLSSGALMPGALHSTSQPETLYKTWIWCFAPVLPPLLQQKQQEQEKARAASWAGESWNPQCAHGEVKSCKPLKATRPRCMQVLPTSCLYLNVPAPSLSEVTTLRLSLALCLAPHRICWPSAQIQRDRQKHGGEEGSTCLIREGPSTGCVC